MTGTIKRVDPKGFGVIDGSNGSKLPFIRSDFAHDQNPRAGQRVIFTIRIVEGRVFASNVVVVPRAKRN